jgi:Putative adhesin
MLPLTTGRRVALAIGVPLCLALTANTGFDIVANVGRGKVPVSYHIPPGARRVSVTASGGNVLLRQGGGQPSLVGTGSYSLVRPDVTERFAAGEATFGYGCPVPEGTCELNATLSVPAGTAVSVSTGGGDVTADGTTGRVSLSTGGGNVSASRVTGDLALSTGGGGIQATGVAATRVTADTGGGDISIVFTQVPRDVQVDTGGGSVTIVVPPGDAEYDVTARTGGGNTNDSVPVNSSSPHVITATTGGGDITIRQGTSP